MMRLRSRAADYDEEDIPMDALETLEMLKTTRPRVGNRKSDEERGAGEDISSTSDPDELNESHSGMSSVGIPSTTSPYSCSEDEEMNDQNVSSSDFEINENAKEEGINNLFDFGKECCVDDRMEVVVTGECGSTSPPSNSG